MMAALKRNISVIGLGYVGLPLAIEFIREEKFNDSLNQNRRIVIGFDIDSKRIEELKNGFESTNEIKKSDLYLLNKIKLTSSVNELREVNVFIVTVPTPIDKFKNPDTSALQNASKMIGDLIKDTDKSNKNFPPIVKIAAINRDKYTMIFFMIKAIFFELVRVNQFKNK